jgi:hypothetical protein
MRQDLIFTLSEIIDAHEKELLPNGIVPTAKGITITILAAI